jgi:hypothetical protein
LTPHWENGNNSDKYYQLKAYFMAFHRKLFIGLSSALLLILPLSVFPDQKDWKKTEVTAKNWEQLRCADGSVFYSINCAGRYCEDKTVTCIHYSAGNDPDARASISKPFPKEKGEQLKSESNFIHGLLDYKETKELKIRFLVTEKLINTGNCGWDSITDKNSYIVRCPDNTLPAGIRCDGEECQTIELYCCEYQYTGSENDE